MWTFDPIELLLGAAAVAAVVLTVTELRARRLRRPLEARIAELDRENDHLADELTLASAQPVASSSTVPALERKYWELHELICRLLDQRDVWVSMWRQQAAEHLQGQAIYEQRIVALRQLRNRAVATANRLGRALHEARGDDQPFQEITGPKDLDPLGDPVGRAEAYYLSMKKLLAAAPKDFDPFLERDRITAEAGFDGLFRHKRRTVRAVRLAEPEVLFTPYGTVDAPAGSWVVRHDSEVHVYEDSVFQHHFELLAGAEAMPDEDEKAMVAVLHAESA